VSAKRLLRALLPLFLAAAAHAQQPQNATLRSALRAYDNVDLTQAITLAHRALAERMAGPDQARAYELLGYAYSALDSADKAITAFKQVLFIEPDHELDSLKLNPKVSVAFELALSQILVVRQLRVDSSSFVGGQGAVGIRYRVTEPARVRVTAVNGNTVIPIDSSVGVGTVNLRWPVQLPSGDPVPAGTYQIIAEAHAGQNTFSASQTVVITHGTVDTVAHLTSLPGYQRLPEQETPPRSWRPMGLAFLYTAVVGAGTVALENSNLGTASRRELAGVSAAALVAGFVMTLKKPAPQPALGNILYNQLLTEQIARRNQEIAADNVRRRQQVQMVVAPAPKARRVP